MSRMESTLISHSESTVSLATKVNAIKERISNTEKDPEKVQNLFALVDELVSFDFGKFLILNQGLNGHWTHYLISEYKNKTDISPLEKSILNFPSAQATRERFKIFQNHLASVIKSNDVICSIPCGVMADLLTLKLSKDIENIKFVGIDLDASAFAEAHQISKENKITHYELKQMDAWKLDVKEAFNVITSNGLNIYEKDDDRVTNLYKIFFLALKPGGTLIISALSAPSEWKIDPKELALQGMIFINILQATWNNFRKSELTISQLKTAGFNQITIDWDKHRMFPTFIAKKPETGENNKSSTTLDAKI